ncbi:Prospero homeobox protein 2 Homeobox prospero-like protein PROX2 [Collichthys lucidus]|uniref:Prospero homeobox protein 2 Homeobox prospero-like protein PROX2 n=1 Tax=Collichthys lucidus TaxID=240159 RepID=A0A4U5UNQ0_COLLU|nr:Prospero homeobox protein 2 Homeobox prospero-like protein PROX2 [Collichthys lucidus]
MYSSSNICLDGCTTEHLSSLQPDPMLSNLDVSNSGVCVTLQQDSENIKMLQESAYYNSSGDAGSVCSDQLELNPSRDAGHLSAKRHPSPASSSCGLHDWSLNSGHQAKRARVENIIKGMTSSPGMHCMDVTTNQHEESDGMQGSEMIQELPSHQERSGKIHSQVTRKQLEGQHFRHLRASFNHVDGVDDATGGNNEEMRPTWNNSPDTSPRDACTDSYGEFESSSSRKYQGWKKVKLMNYFQSKPERIKLMADVLKYELSRAVSRSVDAIFKSMPLLQTPPNIEGNVKTDMSPQPPVCRDNTLRLSCCGNAEVPDVQTEALSLVVQKPQLERAEKFILQSRSRAHHHPKPPTPFSYDSSLHEEELSEKDHNTARQHALRCFQDGCSEVGQTKFEMFDAHWNSVKARSKVNSRSVRSPQSRTVSVDPMILQGLCLPHVKIESDSLVKNNLYMLNEGLTTNHLKKAKLMFFYTRYPSSLVLKMCFHDVQFTRCITSQLIKWFSNFREFYYIQMEKFARHALIDGVANVRGLTVGRESELFRALNMHYNKANDFQVPDRFLEVAEITLREFYIAISVGKDRDPSWKKAIYKVICKLDGDVPAEFKNHPSG